MALIFPLQLFLILLQIVYISAQSCSANVSCTTPSCCSQWGSCGFGPAFCGTGCQRDCESKPECGIFSDTQNCPLKVCCSQFGFCGTTPEFCNAGCMSNCVSPPVPSCGNSGEFLRIGYYASWSAYRSCQAFKIDNIDPRNYTHLNFAFATISGGIIAPSAEEGAELLKFSRLKQINGKLKTLASVGGWAFNDPGPTREEFHNIAATVGSRATFVQSVISFLEQYGLDGIDIDWEYPGATDRGGYPEDGENYVYLVRDLRIAFGSRYVLTIAAPASYWYLRHFRPSAMAPYLDWINVMTYDFHGTWDADSQFLGPYVRPHTDMTQIEDAFKLFWKDGVVPSKLVLGLGFYGRAFTLKDPSCNTIGCEFSGPAQAGPCTNAPGSLALFEINQMISENGINPSYDQGTQSEILSWGDQWVAYDDELTLGIKTEWARSVCASGVMIWSIDQGVDRVADGSGLQRSGSVTMARFHLHPDFLSEGQAPAWILDYDRDSSLGFDAYVITAENFQRSAIHPKVRQLDNPGGCGDDMDIDMDGLMGAYRMIMLAYGRFSQPNGEVGSAVTLEIDDFFNPVTSVTRRLIGHTAQQPPQPVYRTETLRAIIHPWHLSPSRNDFTSNFVYQYLNGIQGMDDRGHILASSLGGRGGTDYYNLAPQYWRLNQHSVGNQDWVAMENQIRDYFRRNETGHVEYNVVLYYPIESYSGRPQSWSWAVEFSDLTVISGVVTNGDQSGVNVFRPGWAPPPDPGQSRALVGENFVRSFNNITKKLKNFVELHFGIF